MPTKTGKTPASTYGNDLTIDQAGNTGIDATTRRIQDGFGNNTAISLSDDVLRVSPVNDNSLASFQVRQTGGSSIFGVDTTNGIVRGGVSYIPVTTLIKEMGIYDFSPNGAGYHYPLIANTMFIPTGAQAFAYDDDFGNGADPATTLDVSGLTQQENAIAIYWYLDNNITLDSVRVIGTSDGTATLNLHLFSYALDVSSDHGDLSGGTVHASGSISASATTIRTDTLTLDTADIDVNRVVIGFVENATDTSDVSISLNIKYHVK